MPSFHILLCSLAESATQGNLCKEDTIWTHLAVLYRKVSLIQRQIYTQLYEARTADSDLIREVSSIQSVLYGEVPLYHTYHCIHHQHAATGVTSGWQLCVEQLQLTMSAVAMVEVQWNIPLGTNDETVHLSGWPLCTYIGNVGVVRAALNVLPVPTFSHKQQLQAGVGTVKSRSQIAVLTSKNGPCVHDIYVCTTLRIVVTTCQVGVWQ